MKKVKLCNVFIILIPAQWACFVDLLLTSFNQPSEYWLGNLQSVNESNPIINYFMQISIFGLFVFVALWLFSIGIIGYYLSPKLFKILSLFVLTTHTYGAASWLAINCGFWTLIYFILLNTILFIVVEDIYTIRTSNI